MAEKHQSEPFIEDAIPFPTETPKRQRGTPEPDARRRRAQQRRRRNSVFQYIAILFIAAFVLLLYTFMMERRQSQQQIDDLKQSVSTVQTLHGLMEENEQLKDQVAALQNQIDALQNQINTTKREKADLNTMLEDERKVDEAMTWFWQLNDIYVRGRLKDCRTMIAAMEEAGVVEFLPKTNTTGQDFLSPADRYQEIHNRVIK